MKTVLLAFAFIVSASAALADPSVQFQMPGVQVPKGDNVGGFRVVFLHGKNRNVRGFDLGLLSLSESDTQSGMAWNMGVGKVATKSSGCAASLINVHSGTDTGVNAAFINLTRTISAGGNIGFLNITDGYSAVDVGGISTSQKSDVQIGFINISEEITGVQIGFLNIAQNGFLPVFPFFNFPR